MNDNEFPEDCTLKRAAGVTVLLQYICPGCDVIIQTAKPVQLTCQSCDETLRGNDLV